MDGLRAIACLSVLIHHARGQWFDGIALAHTGVALFFCLSGFLIFILAAREHARTGTLAIRRFYLRRVLRIWPLYFAVVVGGLLLYARPGLVIDAKHFRGLSATEYFLGYGYAFPLFLSNWFLAFNHIGGLQWFAPPFLAVTWSIAVEEQFYALFPLAFRRVMRPRFPRSLFVISALLVGLIVRTAFAALPLDGNSLGGTASDAGLYYFSLSYIDMFVLGAVAGSVYIRRGSLSKESPRTMTALFVTSLLATLALMFVWGTALWPPYRSYSPIMYTLMAAALSCLIYAVVANPTARYAAALRARPLRVLGFLSYGMYLGHAGVYQFLTWRMESIGPRYALPAWADQIVTLVYALAFVVAVATIMYVLVERPFLLLKRGRRHPEADPGAPTSLSIPWRKCLIGALTIMVAFEVLYWHPLT